MVFTGIIIRGQQRGKKLGFPTANTPLTKEIQEGIYLSLTTLQDEMLPSLTFIGAAETFDEDIYQAETYILNFDRDIYGEKISVRLLEKIRGNKKFDSEEALVKQMEHDKMTAEQFFQNYDYADNK